MVCENCYYCRIYQYTHSSILAPAAQLTLKTLKFDIRIFRIYNKLHLVFFIFGSSSIL